jgi:hypothetical protein
MIRWQAALSARVASVFLLARFLWLNFAADVGQRRVL